MTMSRFQHSKKRKSNWIQLDHPLKHCLKTTSWIFGPILKSVLRHPNWYSHGFLLDHGFLECFDRSQPVVKNHTTLVSQLIWRPRDMWKMWLFVLGGFLLTPNKMSIKYCWWFRNPKQPPGMYRTTVSGVIFTISTGAGYFSINSMFACKYQKPYHNSKLRLCSQQLRKSLWNSVNYWLVKAGSNSRGLLQSPSSRSLVLYLP